MHIYFLGTWTPRERVLLEPQTGRRPWPYDSFGRVHSERCCGFGLIIGKHAALWCFKVWASFSIFTVHDNSSLQRGLSASASCRLAPDAWQGQLKQPIPLYPYREYFQANVYTIWVHGPLGIRVPPGTYSELWSSQMPKQHSLESKSEPWKLKLVELLTFEDVVIIMLRFHVQIV